jgi:catechol 2,3-dioxygenase-like lactoylglutathione lyase family enzyme
MIDHIGIPVTNYAAAKTFYENSLAPLGVRMMMEVPREHTGGRGVCGFGAEQPQFWISDGNHTNQHVHVAFAAKSREAVDAFYAAAMAAGAKDNGKPGLRPHYHEHYYGGFIIDLDGNNVEAVCHLPT